MIIIYKIWLLYTRYDYYIQDMIIIYKIWLSYTRYDYYIQDMIIIYKIKIYFSRFYFHDILGFECGRTLMSSLLINTKCHWKIVQSNISYVCFKLQILFTRLTRHDTNSCTNMHYIYKIWLLYTMNIYRNEYIYKIWLLYTVSIYRNEYIYKIRLLYTGMKEKLLLTLKIVICQNTEQRVVYLRLILCKCYFYCFFYMLWLVWMESV
jgi:hypothetical protein